LICVPYSADIHNHSVYCRFVQYFSFMLVWVFEPLPYWENRRSAVFWISAGTGCTIMLHLFTTTGILIFSKLWVVQTMLCLFIYDWSFHTCELSQIVDWQNMLHEREASIYYWYILRFEPPFYAYCLCLYPKVFFVSDEKTFEPEIGILSRWSKFTIHCVAFLLS